MKITGSEYSVEVPKLTDRDVDYTISVDKIGGGTLGSSYEGTWSVVLWRAGWSFESEHINTGTPKTHEQVAKIYADFLVSYWPEDVTSDRFALFALEDE